MIYAGDNDLGDGKSAEAVYNYFLQLCQLFNSFHDGIPITYISIKPSISRWGIRHKIKLANELISEAISAMPMFKYIDIYSHMILSDDSINAELFDEDGLHLNKAGYTLWKNILLTNNLCNNDGLLI